MKSNFLTTGTAKKITDVLSVSQRVSQFQTYKRGVDTRSGSLLSSDKYTRRVMIGALPDGTYGIAVTKKLVDVVDALSA